MVSIILLALLIMGFFVGLKRGFILQLLHLTSFVIAFLVAAVYFDDLASKLELWVPYPEFPEGESWAIFLDTLPLEAAFYNAIAFAVLFFVTKIVLQILATMLDFVADLPILNFINSWLGAILGFVEFYFILFVILYLLALAPLPEIQALIEGSGVANFMLEHTPILSERLQDMLFANDTMSDGGE
ncbi:hypothetical protein J416_07572 [Gracilibacillus halophilus YIM-C55.5]|uniref:Colicin V production protein n=1 Tax=Gracilibacillus halophilus YIM-C55.5 TaxID=1308866 RepID=N4WLK8_9BACI|nr:CvpA family protein [Gracilibacillus halophilus]ENH97037.1 hypothetical protein J416_07572 [Gracilibacillus halophilus YIM-C55.5]